MTEMEEHIYVFSLDENLELFKKIEENYEYLSDALDSRMVYLVIDHNDKIVWIWNGAEAKVRMKFIATQKAPVIRDKYGIDYKIMGIDEGNEPTEFKMLLGLD